MNRRAAVLLALLALLLGPARGAVLGSMYSDRLLESRAVAYREVIVDKLKVYLAAMTPAQRAVLSGMALDIPLRDADRTAFGFFATSSGVTLPAMSIRFLADLALAQAWLVTQGYAVSTVYDYVTMIKYQQAPPAGWPEPRTALRIPANAEDDAAADQLSLQLFNQALDFVILHELGHVVLQHPGYGPGVTRVEARANEAEADRFALNIMRRVGEPPLGVHFLFAVFSHLDPNRVNFQDEPAYQRYLSQATHPLSPQRMRDAAAVMRANAQDFAKLQLNPERARARVTEVARQVDDIADQLDDLKVQRALAQRAGLLRVSDLAPRRP
jgi:Zn-dependent protease with chaperone function